MIWDGLLYFCVIMRLFDLFNQPYPLATYKEAIYRDVFFSAFLTAFILIFRPFGLDLYPYSESYIIAAYGLIALFTGILADTLFYNTLPFAREEKRWTTGKNILMGIAYLVLFGTACFCYAVAIDAFPFSIAGYLKVQLYVTLCAIVPIGAYTLIRQNYLLVRNRNEADILDNALSAEQHIQKNEKYPETIRLTGENKNEVLELSLQSILYITAQDNYSEIVYLDETALKRELLRSSLSRTEHMLTEYPLLFRSHRSFLVNLSKVIKVKGNAQGYLLVLDGTSATIPVARTRGAELKSKLAVRP